MTVNEKIYPVKLDHSGWWLVAYVTADVGPREFENAWFAAFEDQTAVVSGFPRPLLCLVLLSSSGSKRSPLACLRQP